MTTPRGKRGTAAPRQITADLVREALSFIPADTDRETWVRVAMAVKASDLTDAQAFELWNEWSARGATYSERHARDTWRSVKASGSVQVGTLFGIAKDHGFRFPEPGATAVQTPAPDVAERLAEEKRQRLAAEEAETARKREESAHRCQVLWDGATEKLPASGCPYLQRKGVGAHGLRFLPGGTALVPMRDAAGRLWSLQRLLPKRLPARAGREGTDKLYGPPPANAEDKVSSRKLGLWHLVGTLHDAPVLLVAEGYATAASVHEATGRPVVVAFDAGNVLHVARELRALHPALPLLLCGDDDRETEARTGKNPGRDAASRAAQASAQAEGRAGFVLPVFPGDNTAGLKDFNDLAELEGPEAVRSIIEAACAALLAGDLQAPAEKPRQAGKAARGGPNGAEAGEPVGDGTNGPPNGGGSSRSADAAGESDFDPFEVTDSGVFFLEKERKPMRLCARLDVLAHTRAEDTNGWGFLVKFNDRDGNPKTWAMPESMLNGEGSEWAARLRDMGLWIAYGARARSLVGQYINTRRLVDRATCTDRVGWHGSVYVLPSSCIGTADGRQFVFQSEAGMEDTFRLRGDLAQWQMHVAGRAAGNSRLVFALCCAFAGPMLRLASMESGGFHLRGTSSMGKTTALKVAASVWGRPAFMQQWRTTDNALEATAVQHCDCTLILDEFAQLDPRVAGECAYMLSNEQEKGRNTRGGLNRKRRTWRLLFLSSGEISLADHMAEGGRRVQAGMEVRMADIPLDAGAGMGGIEDIHDHEGPADLAEAITRASAQHYGTAGRAWLEWACAHHAELPARLQVLVDRYRADFVPESASEQVRRVGARFALVAAAGELATEARISGWAPQHAAWAVRQCFNAWLAARGHLDNGEDAAMLRQVRACLEKNGDALFTYTHRGTDDHKAATPLRLGFKRLVDEHGKPLKIDAAVDYVDKLSAEESSERRSALTEFLILPEAFKREVCKGFDAAAVARVLRRRGHLVHEADRLTTKQRLPGMGKATCYHVKPSIFGDDFGGL